MPEQHIVNGRGPVPEPRSAHLAMGRCNPAGSCIEVNNRYLLKDGKPWLPVMGEFHYSRYPRPYWEEAVLKLKAAGVDIVASYVFWNHHEETKGAWDWSGNRSLRDLVELCARHDLYCFPRIGPWAHGEVRYGGFPDWLLRACPVVRQDDPTYLGYVRGFYKQIGRQVAGCMFKDGGAIIGIQIENEYGHVAGKGHPEHILTLKRMAIEAGFDVPLYTVTGWGGAWVPTGPDGQGEVLPVLGGYPAAPWAQHTSPLDPVPIYLFQQYASDPNVGSDLATRTIRDTRFDHDDFPYLTAETGGGNQVTSHRRPLLSAQDVAAIPLTQLGSGTNLIGYYMFHGGTNPVGRHSTLQESRDTGYPNDVPVLSYDFQAPVREYGQLHESYRRLKLLHLFLQDFGEQLAPLAPVLPAPHPEGPADAETLRMAVRTDGHRGFLFVNNHHRHVAMQAHTGVDVKVELDKGEVSWLPFDVQPGAGFIWPFNLDLDGVRLVAARAQLVCRLPVDGETTYVFAATPGVPPSYHFAADTVEACEVASGKVSQEDGGLHVTRVDAGLGAVIELRTPAGRTIKVLTLTHAQALNLWKGEVAGTTRLVLTPSDVMFDRGELLLTDREAGQTLWLYPDPAPTPLTYQGQVLQGVQEGLFTVYRMHQTRHTLGASVEPLPDRPYMWRVRVPVEMIGGPTGVEDIFLRLHIACDSAHLYLGDRLIADTFYTGEVWEIGLKRFEEQLEHASLRLVLLPLWWDAGVYIEHRPTFVDGVAARVERVEAVPEYRFRVI